MHDYPPLVSGALILLFRHFSQRQEFLIAFNQVQPLVSDNDVNSYKQIKDDLDGLRLLVEKSELWVYKPKSVDEKPSSVNNKSKSSISSGKNSSSQVGSGKTSKFMVNGSIKEEDEGQDERQPSPGKTFSRNLFFHVINQGPLITDGRNSCEWTRPLVVLAKTFIMVKISVQNF